MATTLTGYLDATTVAIGQRVEVEAFCHIWHPDTPKTVKKNPNRRPARSAKWIVGYEWRLIGGVVENIDDAHVNLKMCKNSEGERPHRGVNSSLNFYGWIVEDGEVISRYKKIRAIRPL